MNEPTVTEVLQIGWDGFKRNVGFFLFLMLATIVISGGLNFLSQSAGTTGWLLSLASWVISVYFSTVGIRAALVAARGQKVDFALFGQFNVTLFVKFVFGGVLLGLIFGVALMLFVLPVLLAIACFFPVYYLYADKNADVLGAFAESFATTRPRWKFCLLLATVTCALLLVGTLLVGVGLLIASPVVGITLAAAYLRLFGDNTVEKISLAKN